jgi:hypothetical protein
MGLTLTLNRLDQIEKGCADLPSKHRRAVDNKDLEEAWQLQGAISDLLSKVQNLKSEIRRER